MLLLALWETIFNAGFERTMMRLMATDMDIVDAIFDSGLSISFATSIKKGNERTLLLGMCTLSGLSLGLLLQCGKLCVQ